MEHNDLDVDTNFNGPLLVDQFPELLQMYNQQPSYLYSPPEDQPVSSDASVYFSAPSPHSEAAVPRSMVQTFQNSSIRNVLPTRYSIHDFIFKRTLGTGSFGRVHLGTRLALNLVSGYY